MKRRGSATTHQPVIERGMGPGTEAQPEAPPKRKRGRPRGSGSNRGGTTGRATQVTKPHPIEQQQQQQQQHNMQFQPQLPRNPGLDRGQHLAQYQQHTVAPEQPEVVFVSINNGTQYKCTEKLGEGTYGVVYKAIVNVLPQQQQQQRTGAKERESGFSPQRHNDLVAVKSFKATKDAEGISTTIYREMCLLRELSHENIIKLLDVVLQPEKRVICLVYEYGELDLFVKKHFTLSRLSHSHTKKKKTHLMHFVYLIMLFVYRKL